MVRKQPAVLKPLFGLVCRDVFSLVFSHSLTLSYQGIIVNTVLSGAQTELSSVIIIKQTRRGEG
jgi:hypothetical protein